MKNLILLIFTLLFLNGFSQNTTFKLDGNWKTSDTAANVFGNIRTWRDSSFVPFYISFKNDGAYIRQAQNLKNKNTYFNYCFYIFNKDAGRLDLKSTYLVDSSTYEFEYVWTEKNSFFEPSYKLEIINDSLIRCRGKKTYYNEKTEEHYHKEFYLYRIASADYRDFDSVRLARENAVDSMLNRRIYLVSTKNLKDTIELKTGGECDFFCSIPGKKYDYRNRATYSILAFGDLSDSTMNVFIQSGTEEYLDSTGTEINRHLPYKSLKYNSKPKPLSIPSIREITYSGPKKFATQNFFSGIGGMALTTAILVAPLVSIKYSNWDFNKQRYFKVGGISLALAVISGSISLATAPKTYSFYGDDSVEIYRFIRK